MTDADSATMVAKTLSNQSARTNRRTRNGPPKGTVSVTVAANLSVKQALPPIETVAARSFTSTYRESDDPQDKENSCKDP
jgi:hypothetical protein